MNVKKVLIVIGIVVGAAVVLCLRSNVPDNGVGADTVREQLDGAIRNQQQAVSDLRTAENTAEGVRAEIAEGRKSVNAALRSAVQLEEGNARAAELIRDCQKILRTVCERGTR